MRIGQKGWPVGIKTTQAKQGKSYLGKNYRLIVEPLVDLIDDESLKGCKEIDIKGVVDYHDGKIEWLIP